MQVRVLRQHGQGECGLIALLMMCDGFGVRHDVADKREKYDLGARGANLETLCEIGEELGLVVRAVKFDLEDLADLKLPAVIHWEMDHFVTLTKVKRGEIEIIDPGVGRRRVKMKEASAKITGVGLVCDGVVKRGVDVGPRGEREEIGWGWVLRMTIRRVPALVVIALVLEMLALCVPQVGQIMIDGVVATNSDDMVLTVIVGFGMLSVMIAVLSIAKHNVMLANNVEGKMVLGGQMVKRLLYAPIRWSEGKGAGEILNRFAAMGQLQQTASTAVMSSMLDGLVSVLAAGLMFAISPGLATICLLCICISIGVRTGRMRHLREQSAERMLSSGKEQSFLIDTVRGLQSIKLAGAEGQRLNRMKQLMANRLNCEGRIARSNARVEALISSISGIENVVIYGLGCMSVLSAGNPDKEGFIANLGIGTIGALIAFVAYKQMVNARLNGFASAVVNMMSMRPALEQAGEILRLQGGELDLGGGGKEGEPLSVEFRRVSFRHGPQEPWVVKDVSFVLEAGERLVVMGKSGSGKSTIAKLMLGILKPTVGQVLIGGVDLESRGAGWVRGQMGAVLQEDQMFGGSVRENVTMGREDLVKDVEKACELARIHEDIKEMAMGYRTLVGEGGSGISGGQKQRVLLARAVIRNPGLLVMDEATSALDRKTELSVLKGLKEMDCTKVFITHNPKGIEEGAVVLSVRNGRATVVGMPSIAGNGANSANGGNETSTATSNAERVAC